ncbi:MAG: Rne/Rng family ribonuclease [Stappiaceae bacterium]
MANKMLIDAAHPEETRVVVVRGNRVEEFDFEAANRKQLRGNIYLAKVTRVEPSLQAAFVEYGGNRHGFLAFSEIHPDYYQIPLADRQALFEEEAIEEEEPDSENVSIAASAKSEKLSSEITEDSEISEDNADDSDQSDSAEDTTANATDESETPTEPGGQSDDAEQVSQLQSDEPTNSDAVVADTEMADVEAAEVASESESADEETEDDDLTLENSANASEVDEAQADTDDDSEDEDDQVESVGAEDAMEEVPVRARRPRKHYKIQEVIKRRQVLLVQVVKEERGNKGAALTTYLSLAGRYSVLMPNTARGGGISRKITAPADRKRLKKIASELEVPEGMGVILRTAGAMRTKAEIKRDFEYLLRLWENVRELTLASAAPCLVYEEGSLIKRSIRDLYNKDIEEVLVSGDEGYREAKDFMRMLMPSHAKNVQPYRDAAPLFTRFGIESQLDAMFSPEVTLRSGGYIVINQTEALVSIDVNSGKSTREHSIEDTAVQTNLEAAEEVARQLRLRDLAGLIVIDFIDMEENRNNRAVERKMKDCLKSDRARIQVGRISHFGLLEMSRQRIRTGVLESSTEHCPHCHGTGIVRSTESVALHVLRSLEDFLLKGVSNHLTVRTRTAVSLYILNQKRVHLAELEQRFGLTVIVTADEALQTQHYVIERNEPVEPRAVTVEAAVTVQPDTIEPVAKPSFDAEEEEDTGGRKRKRRRRKRSRNGNNTFAENAGDQETETKTAGSELEPGTEDAEITAEADGSTVESDSDGDGRKKRRRGRRGGRRSRRSRDGEDNLQREGQAENAPAEVTVANNDATQAESAVESTAESDAASADTDANPEPVNSGTESETVQSDVSSDSSSENEDGGVRHIPITVSDTSSTPSEEVLSNGETNGKQPQPETVAATQPEDEAAQTADTAEAPQDEKPRSKRGGWWQRRSFF